MEIPEGKRYFRIGEVSRMLGVEPYVLRYWESEFPQIRPSRADSNQRTYQRKDLEIILEIKRLLYDEKMTIEGARRKLKRQTEPNISVNQHVVEEVKRDLQNLLKLLT